MAEYLVPIINVKVFGFRYCAILGSWTRSREFHLLIVPHWMLVLPLTALAAYLILWKPRQAGAGQKCEPCVPETTQQSLTDLR